jgi:hypothetical protein
VRTSLGAFNSEGALLALVDIYLNVSTMDGFPFQFDPTAFNGQINQANQPALAPAQAPAPGVQIEELSLPDLMKNRHVQAMYKDWKDASNQVIQASNQVIQASNQVIQASQMQQTLWQENSRLVAEVSALKDGNRDL